VSSFGWVDRRADCSLFAVFSELKMGVKNDIEARAKQGPKQAPDQPVRFRFKPDENNENRFSVLREGHQLAASVEFGCDAKGIYASDGTGKDLVRGTVTLNDEGDCRLKVADASGGIAEVTCWQFRRRALEELFFGF
jgi:hypothetical protein